MIDSTLLAEDGVQCVPLSVFKYMRLCKGINTSALKVLHSSFIRRMLMDKSFCYTVKANPYVNGVCHIALIPCKSGFIVDIVVSKDADETKYISHALRMIMDNAKRITGVTKFYSYSTAHALTRKSLKEVGFTKAYNNNGIRVYSIDLARR